MPEKADDLFAERAVCPVRKKAAAKDGWVPRPDGPAESFGKRRNEGTASVRIQKKAGTDMATEKRRRGDLGEEFAAAWLERQGYQILARNFLTKMGELDIVAKKDDIVSVVEVKSRAEDCLYAPREAVTATKRKRICKAAVLYTMETGEKAKIRFDVFEVIYEKTTLQIKSYTFIPNAFEMEVRL